MINDDYGNAELEQLEECDRRIDDAIAASDFNNFIVAIVFRRQALSSRYDKETLDELDDQAMEKWNAAH